MARRKQPKRKTPGRTRGIDLVGTLQKLNPPEGNGLFISAYGPFH